METSLYSKVSTFLGFPMNYRTSKKCGKKVQVGKDQEKAQSEKDSHSKNRGGKKTKLTIRYLYHETSLYRDENVDTILFLVL